MSLESLARRVVRFAYGVDGPLWRALDGLVRVPAWPRDARDSRGSAALRAQVPMLVDVASGVRHHGRAPRATAPPDHRVLTRADVEIFWQQRHSRAMSAFRNFAALRFIRMPVQTTAGWEIEASLRAVVNALGDDEDLPRLDRERLYRAVVIAFVTLPLGMGLPSPFGIVDDIDRIVDDAPRIRAAVQRAWSIVDDPAYWMSAGSHRARVEAV